MEPSTVTATVPPLFGRHLSELMAKVVPIGAKDDRFITGLSSDSRTVAPGDLYFACRGRRYDGGAFIEAACAAGAVAVVVEAGPVLPARCGAVPVLAVADLSASLGLIAHRFFGEPSRALKVIGVTGTNGKTSVSHYVAQALHHWVPEGGDARPCGLIGTLGYGVIGDLEPGLHTTPDAITTHRRLAEIRSRRARFAVLEASSHGLDQRRTAEVAFHIAVFTNLSRDHLDYHGSMSAYGAAKRRLFHSPGLAFAVLNLDDPFGNQLLDELPSGVEPLTFGIESVDRRPAVTGRIVACTPQGLAIAVQSPWGSGEVTTNVIGRFNASNLLAVLTTLLASGMPMAVALARIKNLTPVPGRMECFGGRSGLPLVVVDYAHSPGALAAVLATLRERCAGVLWCVVGCGGERDQGKRPLMGATAARAADVIVLTDDNPRGEDGQRIIDEMLAGVPPRGAVIVERDRELAIRYAVQTAAPEDVILVAGKGHEQFQERAGVRRPFSDPLVVRNALREYTP